MANAEAPSFSLGFDFDLDSEPQLDPGLDPFTSDDFEHLSSFVAPDSEEEDTNDDHNTTPTTDLGLQVPAPDRPLKRLRRGPASDPPLPNKKVCFDVDDDIEEFSSQEDRIPDTDSKHPYSVGSSSKLSLRSRGVLSSQNSQKTHDTKARKTNVVPNVTASANTASASNKAVLPELTVSPLRRFQLIDSDSDSDSDFDECFLDKAINQDDSPVQHSNLGHVPTPAFDEVLEEYFQSTNHNNTPQYRDENCYQARSLDENNVQQSELGTLPPAHSYYFHKDPRIQKLVCARLPNFSPLHTESNVGHKQQNACGIDYMSQFCQGEASKQANQKEMKQPSTSRSQKNARKTSVQELSQGSRSWVNPRNCEIPKDAGKRRVQAVGNSGGHWYTDNGRRVYVAKNGQELSGQIAYRQYKKDKGAGSKKSKKKTSTKKKAAAKKK